jgi:hypothetical protein
MNALLTKLKLSTKANSVGLIRLKPKISELDFLETSMFEILKKLPISKLVAGSTQLMESNTCNTVMQVGEMRLFLKIVNNEYLLYAATNSSDINVTKYYASLSQIASEL